MFILFNTEEENISPIVNSNTFILQEILERKAGKMIISLNP